MRIRHLEQIFSIDKVVPVDVLSILLADSHTFLYESLLLSTTILNDRVPSNKESIKG